MVHCFAMNGTRLVFDGHSQVLHEVDEMAWSILSNGWNDPGEAVRRLGNRYPVADITGALAEIEELRAQELLFAPDPYAEYAPAPSQVKGLCLNMAHHCNLACRYCFAGAPGTPKKLMEAPVARRAVDFLISGSGARRHVEIDFFGGEPLLNFSVIRETVHYARKQAALAGKQVGFTVTTNGLLLGREIRRFLLENEINVVLSLDGRPEVHDRLRPAPGGKGSHRAVLHGSKQYVADWEAWAGPRGYYYVRGTFTGNNLDFAEDFRYLAGLGFSNISLEPVVALPCADYALRKQDLARVHAEYARLAEIYLDLARENPAIRFFHFELDLDEGPCLPKRLSGCGAGHAYLAVDAAGAIYPCHQFIGKSEFLLGDVSAGIVRRNLVEGFRHAHVYAKEECVDCWAKFLCSGGCHAHAYLENGSILKPSRLACATMRSRLEAALFVQASKSGRQCGRQEG
ncbi:MAG: thioether cross-link-forming SCIFF peptide maturase [Candidatus Desulforudis sp.]|nr:thioether cross-link-forming SCIFF peptide maturase [Desulforudis sp.]